MSEAGVESVWSQILAGATGASVAEQIATVLGIVGVWLMMKRSLWSFPVGLVQVAIFGWVCFQARLYSETVLQGMFFAALAYGWCHWARAASAKGEELPISSLSTRARLGWGLGVIALWAIWGAIMQRVGAAMAWADAFVFSVSVGSQILQSRKVVENWPGWLLANVVAVGVFWAKEFYWFSVLYAVFAVMAWGGWREWTRAMRAQRKGRT
ncbi:MAG: nicotinamide mononucleotide transporter [Burkholderiales bacterium]|nr:nicotinamide mononucleotide transporter [Opitutaceae bacterium]